MFYCFATSPLRLSLRKLTQMLLKARQAKEAAEEAAAAAAATEAAIEQAAQKAAAEAREEAKRKEEDEARKIAEQKALKRLNWTQLQQGQQKKLKEKWQLN